MMISCSSLSPPLFSPNSPVYGFDVSGELGPARAPAPVVSVVALEDRLASAPEVVM